MKKAISIIAVFLMTVMSFATVNAAYEQKASDWAKESIEAANQSGILPWGIYYEDLTQPVCRGDMARLIMNAYEAYTGKEYKQKGKNYFEDIYDFPYEDEVADSVYELGIMSGTGEGTFDSYENITREQMAKILLSFKCVILEDELELPELVTAPFVDFDQVSDWAKPYVAKTASDGLIGGYSDGRFGGKDDVSWEMAIALIMRCGDYGEKTVPVIELEWDDILPSGECFEMGVQGEGEIEIYASEAGRTEYSTRIGYCRDEDSVEIRETELDSDSLYYLYAVSDGVFSAPVRVFTDKYNLILDCDMYPEFGEYDIRWARIPGVEQYKVTLTEERDSCGDGFILPNTPVTHEVQGKDFVTVNLNPNRHYKVEISAGTYYACHDLYTSNGSVDNFEEVSINYPQTKEEAQALQTQIKVPVWKINKKGQKYASTATITVHHLIAEELKLVFEDIFNGPEQFPIKDVGGFSWRGKRSEHNGGTAVDINSNENYCVYADGSIVGSHWKPYEDPYSITPYGDVVNAFERHGFTWGGDAWGSPRDYMHFSYLGT